MTETISSRKIQLPGGRTLTATPVFDSYWKFARERQAVYMKRVRGEPPPWTEDTVIANHRFTNGYRASDRVSQYLIRHVQYGGPQGIEDLFYRTMLFKIFNKIETWDHIGPFTRDRVEGAARVASVLDTIFNAGTSIYSAAYIMPSPPFGCVRKHQNHLRLIDHMMRDEAPKKIADAKSLRASFEILRGYPSFGDFLAFQLAIDLNYSILTNFSEMDHVVAGPGAISGIRKCFSDTGGLSDTDVIRAVTDLSESEFARLGLPFQTLFGRPLQLIDCQNLFCETDKYARVVHPDPQGTSGKGRAKLRTKIKQKFRTPLPKERLLADPWFPPKWAINDSVWRAP